MIVYKIGGSSIDDEYKLESILNILKKDNRKKLIVISAIGRYPSPYSTDTLLSKSNSLSIEEKDLLVSTGEIISSIIFSNYLNSNNIKAISLSPYLFNIKNIDKEIIYNNFKENECIIVPGFIYTNNNVMYTLKRGGSTISASLLAKEFSKELIVITDVCGIYDKEPSCSDAVYYPTITYKEFRLLGKTNEFFPKEAIDILQNNKIITTFIKYNDNSMCSKIVI